MAQSATPIRPTNRLRELREAAEESRIEVAHALGFKSAKQIERWELGAEIPTVHARVLATRYAVSISYLLRDANGSGQEAA